MHQFTLGIFACLAACFVLSACGGDADVAGQSPIDMSEVDAGDSGFTDAAVTDVDDTAGGDVAPPDAVDVEPVVWTCDGLGGAGCSCTVATDCSSGVCIDTPDAGKVCTQTCTQACPQGFVCAASPGGPPGSVCLPKWPTLCNPCDADSDCIGVGVGEATCVDRGPLGAFCGAACGQNADCPPGYGCAETTSVQGKKVKQCQPSADNSGDAVDCTCSKDAKEKQLSTSCVAPGPAGAGSCQGARQCGVAGLSACTAVISPETCNGKDDDCNGQTDEATCGDGNACTLDSCDPSVGCQHQNLDGAACDSDGSVCTESDSCKGGVCVVGAAKSCDDKNPCTADSCDAVTGCKHANDDGKACDADGSACTVSDICKAGTCKTGTLTVCDDGNACSIDVCEPSTGNCAVKAADDGTACDDATQCTSNDKCFAGACTGQAVDCDDGNPCTTDSCDPNGGCSQVANQQPCDDGNPCTQGDLCASSACTAGGNICECQKDSDCAAQEDGDLCNGTLYCDIGQLPYACKVKVATVVTCDGSNNTACSVNGCDAKTGECTMAAELDGKGCDADGSVCTNGDACKSGVCAAGVNVDCDDKNSCTTDSCDSKKGCINAPNTALCNADDSLCTTGDACKDGVCLKGEVQPCDDKNSCTTDSCDPSVGCVATPMAEKADCSADGKKWCVAGTCAAKPYCGDGLVNAGGEECDDANTDEADGCTNACTAPCRSLCLTTSYYTTAATSPILFTSAATFFAVVRATAVSGTRTVLSHPRSVGGTGIALGVSDGLWSVYLNNGTNFNGGVYAGKATVGQWTRIAGAYDGKTIKLFVDGKLLGTVAAPPTLSASAMPLYLGSEDATLGRQFVGCIDEAAAWNTSLADAELIALTSASGFGAIKSKPVFATYSNGLPLGNYGSVVNPLKEVPVVTSTLAAQCAPPCGDGQTSPYEQCDDGNIVDGDGCSSTCRIEAALSCKAILAKFGNTPDGVYPIDADGAGPLAAVDLFCDMKNGGWTLVGNYYDSPGDDLPNTTDYVVSGWQQTASGVWAAKASSVDRAIGAATGSSAVSMAFVAALKSSAGQANLKMCFVHKDGYDTTCRSSADGSMTLVSYNTGNPKLTPYFADKLTYTFGRLAGLAGSADGYDGTKYIHQSHCIPRTIGAAGEFGTSGALGLCDDSGLGDWKGVWHGFYGGMELLPSRVDNWELHGDIVPLADPSLNTFGFRLYIGPEVTLGSKATPASSCKAILDAKASLGDGVYWLDPDGSGPIAPFAATCDMTVDGGGWTLVVRIAANSIAHGDNSGAVGDPSSSSGMFKLADSTINLLTSGGYWRYRCGSSYDSYVRNAAKVWTSAKTNLQDWSIDRQRDGVFECKANRAGYVFSDFQTCSAGHTNYAASGGAVEGNGCYTDGEGWGRSGELWTR